MDERRCVEVLRAHNEWRRYEGFTGEPGAPAMVNPTELGQALDHAIATIERERWRPIADAPKDGTELLLARGDRVTFGHWLADEGGITEHRDIDGRWIGQDESDGWEGWMSWDGGFTEEEPPTHWRPLPDPQPDGQEG